MRCLVGAAAVRATVDTFAGVAEGGRRLRVCSGFDERAARTAVRVAAIVDAMVSHWEAKARASRRTRAWLLERQIDVGHLLWLGDFWHALFVMKKQRRVAQLLATRR